MQVTVEATMTKHEDNMKANTFALNRDNTQFMLLHKENNTKSKISIQAHPTNIEPKSTLKFLGVTLSDTLKWHNFLTEGKDNLYKQLQTRLSALKKLLARMNSNLCEILHPPYLLEN